MIREEFLPESDLPGRNGKILSKPVLIPADTSSHEVIDASAMEEYIKNNRSILFVQQLFSQIGKSGKTDSEIYKKAGIDRRLFSKFRANKKYTPAKKTVIALCLALELPRTEADLLLSSAGYSLSSSDDFDLAIAFCIEKKVYNLQAVNVMLYQLGFQVF